jgi:hypothetical protein
MTIANAFDAFTFQAFSLALLQLDPSRLAALHPNPQQISNLATRNPRAAADQIRQLVDQHSDLKAIYDREYDCLSQSYHTQERAKGFSDVSALSLDRWEGFAFPILQANDPVETARSLLKRLKSKHLSQPYITALNRTIAAVDQNEIAVLKAIEQRPIAIEDLVYVVGLPFEQVSTIVQSLWKRGYVDRVNSGFLSMLFPKPKKQDQPRTLDPKIPLALTSTGYFFLHPIITASPSEALT